MASSDGAYPAPVPLSRPRSERPPALDISKQSQEVSEREPARQPSLLVTPTGDGDTLEPEYPPPRSASATSSLDAYYFGLSDSPVPSLLVTPTGDGDALEPEYPPPRSASATSSLDSYYFGLSDSPVPSLLVKPTGDGDTLEPKYPPPRSASATSSLNAYYLGLSDSPVPSLLVTPTGDGDTLEPEYPPPCSASATSSLDAYYFGLSDSPVPPIQTGAIHLSTTPDQLHTNDPVTPARDPAMIDRRALVGVGELTTSCWTRAGHNKEDTITPVLGPLGENFEAYDDHRKDPPVAPVGSPYPYPFNHVRRNHSYPHASPQVPSANYDPNHPSTIQEQLARQWQVYA
ncbi:hypothetical protein DFH09DRAFT_1424385 [Mycena vulgaris]|nr:hypothetical protein DFH09DRAFT_1424385 [Mycena vulgaris]